MPNTDTINFVSSRFTSCEGYEVQHSTVILKYDVAGRLRVAESTAP